MGIRKFFNDEDYKALKSNLIELSRDSNFYDLKRVFVYSFDISEKMLDNMLYFMMIQGRLKTGKSTFINILTNQKVAITKIDNDTTKVPYIITKSRDGENKIIRFSQLKSIPKEMYGDVFNAILNEIMEVEAEEYDAEVVQFFDKKKEIFTLDKVKEYTSDDSSNENLLINIQINANEYSILNENIAIVDTPGLGGKSYVNQNELIKYIRERIDMLFLLQSTLTPFDEVLLKELDTFPSDLNMRLIHNSFELKPWASENEKKQLLKEEDDLIRKARLNISSKIKSDIPVNRFNFGKIEDCLRVKEYKVKLKKEFDKYDDFRRSIVSYIKKYRLKDRENTVIRRIKDNMSELDKFLNEKKVKFEKLNNEIFSIKNQLFLEMDNYLNLIEKNIYNINFMLEPFALNRIINDYFNICISLFEKKIVDTDVGIFSNNIKENLGIIKRFLKQLEECINNNIINDIYKNLLNFFEEFKTEYNNLNELIKNINNQTLPFFRISKEELSKIVFSYDEEELKEIFLGSISKKNFGLKKEIDYEKLKNNIKNYILGILNKEIFVFNEKLKNDLNIVFKNYKNLCTKLKNDLEKTLEESNKEKLEYYKKILGLINESINKKDLLQMRYIQS